MWLRATSLAAFVLCSVSTVDAHAQNSYAGPMDVRRFNVLKSAAQNKANGYWAEVAFQEYNNGLVESLFDKEGAVFCLPNQIKSGAVSDVFKQMTIEVEISVRNAGPSEFVSTLALRHLHRKYPC
jgi:hypothetical protein